MDYEQNIQCSRLYKYGENEEFKTKEEANDAIKKLEQETKTNLAMLKIYELSTTEIHEVQDFNALILMVIIKIPKLFKEK